MQLNSKYEILQRLSELDLSKYPENKVNYLIQELGKYHEFTTTLPVGQVIIRARVNCNLEVFSKAKELSYKPSELNNSYQRASTPLTTMFYGAIMPENANGINIDIKRIIGFCEVSNLFRDESITEGEQTITFGKWVVCKNFDVVSIIHHSDYVDKSLVLKQLQEDYNQCIKEYSKEIIDESLLISEFFAGQFAKSVTHNDYDYLLSAIYTERLTKMKIPGVLYPSVRTEGKGFNIAITPFYADNSLRLEDVVECTVYKKGTRIVADNNKQAILKSGENEFNLEPIPYGVEHLGRERVYKILGEEKY